MMFDEIIQNRELFALLREECEENEIRMKFAENLSEENRLVLKIDAYYHSSRMHNPPPSVDCLIIVRCESGNSYDFHLVELRNVKSPKGIRTKDIERKFLTSVKQFLEKDFSDIFLCEDYHVNRFSLHLLTDAYRLGCLSEEQYTKKVSQLEKKRALFQKTFKFRNRAGTIELERSDSLIEAC